MDASDVGRYGTLKFMKRNDPSTVAAVFPIDDEEVTFGRNPQCDVRLYYDSVSAVHCKIVFQDRKAFLVILGTNGLLIDDSPVYPSLNPSSPTTISLATNSKIEIHKKVFIFQYPPKELRPILLATPARKDKVRMSMIQSAQVFTPQPSKDPRENLRVLQSPIKGSDVVLVDGDHPRVMQEDKDLIIFEDVPQVPRAQPVSTTPSPSKLAVFPPRPPVYQTPRPTRPLRPSLHRAVLIRSAQRTALRAEMERETEEEREVEEAVSEILEGNEDEEAMEEDAMDDDEEPPSLHSTARTSGWQRSFDVVRGLFRSLSRSPERQLQWEPEEHHEEEDEVMQQPQEQEYIDEDDDVDNENDAAANYEPLYPDLSATLVAASSTHEQSQPAPRLQFSTPEPGQRPEFRTPQAQRPPPGARVFTPPRTTLRPSIGGKALDGPRRVKIEPPWKVKDIEVAATRDGDGQVMSPRKRERVDEAERKAILERRRSALTMADSFFGEAIPGVRRAGSVSPVKLAFEQTEVKADDEKAEEEDDARTLLEKVREANEEISRRRSQRFEEYAATPSPEKRSRGRFSLIAPGAVPMLDLRELGSRKDEDEDEDVPMANAAEWEVAQQQLEQAKPSHNIPSTPRMDDLKHVFANKPQPALQTPAVRGVRDLFVHNGAKESPSTPRMDGVRNLFLVEKEMPSAVLEGVDEMLATPEAWRAQSASAAAEKPEDRPEVEKEDPVPAKNGRARRTPTAKRPAQIPKTGAPTRRKNTRTPATGASQLADDEATPQNGESSKGPVDSDEEMADASKAKAPAKRPRVLRGRRVEGVETSAAAAPSQEKSKTIELEADAPLKSTKAPTSRSKPATARIHGNPSEPEAPVAPARKTVRRGRSAAPESTTDSEGPSKPKASTRSRGAKALPISVEQDELDFIERPPSPEEAPKPTKRRGGKVKEEETEDEARKTVKSTTAATRTRKTPVRGRPKEAPPVVDEQDEAEGNVNKENTTPEGSGASAEDAPAPEKRGRPAKSKVKSEEPPSEIPKPVRATRARAAKRT
ncbi:hypothetical protein NEOLEDRAFT_1169008 [Neolentinus lepideus HHB14362 ss-1]|uniref:FHA domain-containing protein n=1 Tax=Neolentinus lepideus HHB14362 ss-1 TaxID=1314782 RepID=A0A165T1S9_9AGAM|nr:hypothetical protein NEOLEDRAFT_1169008 [Neolentinus lepideus HHB14362 ss-1]